MTQFGHGPVVFEVQSHSKTISVQADGERLSRRVAHRSVKGSVARGRRGES